jgi:hypothetical protein
MLRTASNSLGSEYLLAYGQAAQADVYTGLIPAQK